MTRRGLLASLAVSVCGLVLAGGAVAASARAPVLEVTVIHATLSDAGQSIDPRLRDLPQLTRDQPFVRYNVYRLLERRPFPLEPGRTVVLDLPNGRVLQATLDAVTVEHGERRYQLQAQIGEPGKQAFLKGLHVTTSENEPFFVGGQSYQGGTLFLELLVR